MGLAPLLLASGQLFRPTWQFFDTLFRWSRHYWAWSGTLILGIVLAVWLIVQYILISFTAPIQFVIAVCGVFILVFTVLVEKQFTDR